MSDSKIAAQTRTEFGKGSARQARRAGQIPAVIYGHGAEPVHVLLPGQETTLAVRTANAVLELDVDGKDHLTLVKAIQRHPLRQSVDHLDLLTVKRGEKVQVEVSVSVQGEPAPGLALSLDIPAVAVLADALKLPENLVLNIEGRGEGSITAAELELPKNVELEIDPETVIATIDEPVEQDLPEDDAAEPAEAAAEAEAE